MLQNGILAVNDVFLPGAVCGFDLRQRVVGAPAAVFIGEGAEIVPGPVGAGLALVSAGLGIATVFVEVDAVVSGVGEGAVQHDAHAERTCLAAQRFEGRLRAQHRVDLAPVGGVVAVVAVRFKDRAEAEDLHAEHLQRREPVRDAAQRAAEKVVRAVEGAGAGQPFDGLIPVCVDLDVPAQGLVIADALGKGAAAAGKAVGEDLIGHGARRPVRRLENRGADRDGPAPGLAADDAAAAEGEAVGQAEGIGHRAGGLRHRKLNGKEAVGVPLHGLRFAVCDERRRLDELRRFQAKTDGLAAVHGAEGAAIDLQRRVVDQRVRPDGQHGEIEHAVILRGAVKGVIALHAAAH